MQYILTEEEFNTLSNANNNLVEVLKKENERLTHRLQEMSKDNERLINMVNDLKSLKDVEIKIGSHTLIWDLEDHGTVESSGSKTVLKSNPFSDKH